MVELVYCLIFLILSKQLPYSSADEVFGLVIAGADRTSINPMMYTYEVKSWWSIASRRLLRKVASNKRLECLQLNRAADTNTTQMIRYQYASLRGRISLLPHILDLIQAITIFICWWSFRAMRLVIAGADRTSINPMMYRTDCSGWTRPIPLLSMAWLLALPGHRKAWNWLSKINVSMSFMMTDFSYL